MLRKIINFIKNNAIFIILYIIIMLSVIIELPYYIEAPGGLIDANDRIKIDNKLNITGSINMTYVSEIKASIFSVLLAKIKNYDILKKEKIENTKETEDDIYFRNHLLLTEANNNAIILAYTKANKKIEILSNKLYVTYIDEQAKTNLKIGDQILSINNIKISDMNQIHDILNNYSENQKINIEVKNNNKICNRYAYLKKYDNELIIGIMITEQNKVKTDPKLEITFKSSESGPSGGLMLTLAIYSNLIQKDITNGLIISGTGTISKDGVVGSISGVKYKLKGAVLEEADIFFVPNGENYNEAIKEKEKNNYDIEIIGINTFDEAINYLK
ncbi:MAG: hypothetical protein PHN42_04065 [Bacilli bacterium]|nr:hypothetical protein [Bacilli bacterium]